MLAEVGAPTHAPVLPAIAPNQARLGGSPVTIGRRGGGADIQVEGMDVALRHTVVRRHTSGVVVRDLNAGTGTFVDGRPVLRAPVFPGETFLVGHNMFRVLPDGVLSYESLPAPPSLVLSGLTVRHHRADAPTMRDISVTMPKGGMLAVIGPSGAGKSTLCAGLLGEAVVESGWASVDDVPLGDGRPLNPALVSFVPQGSPLLDELTVEQTMHHAAHIRFAADAPTGELTTNINDVLRRLHLDSHTRQHVATLSGGQRRRLSIAVELLSRPLLLILDEPTSGLDEGLDRALMRDLADVARNGCAVIVVTHAMTHLSEASTVLAIATGGTTVRTPATVGYTGNPDDLLAAFDARSAADVMDALRAGQRASQQEKPSDRRASRRHGFRAGRTQPLPHVLSISLKREFLRVWLRKPLLAALAVIGPAAAALLAVWSNPRGLTGSPTDPNPDLGTALAVTCICLSLLAMALSLTSVVNDREVIRRERRWGVPYLAVVLSRAISRGFPALAQAAVATAVLCTGSSLQENTITGLPAWLEIGAALASLTLCSMTIGLLISCLSSTTEQAVGAMSALSGGSVVLCGIVLPLGEPSGFGQVLTWLSLAFPTRWATGALGSATNLPHAAVIHPDAMWTHDLTHLALPIGLLFAASGLICVVAPILLKRSQ
ncbi:ATP-binding cassette domain-containing protein [Actinophytocola sp.]|uniref:ATP-binding cassette domain-containing protein n=1 Tax=Actinophytocola sp. TaxID=1872138 RepID=UPI002D41F675|nr:ATP-binding cassette domain-containing protein [Actinophytocola sp.]HYQ69833.1 ATP-binding cassette domain-containing protein [Actinophytocola sp.]